MKHDILTALALTSILLAGCDSDSKDSTDKTECTNGEFKADCIDGNISKCVNGKWTQTACENDFSCNANNQCGECKDGDEKDCHEGKVSRCVNGEYQEVDCENNVSCTTDGKCGACKNGDTSKCTNDSLRVGSALVCKDGKWSDNAEKCPDMYSCSMTEECYQCYHKCNAQFTCNDDCKDTTCKDECDNYAVCIKQCDDNNNGCDAKCGECLNEEHINCTENNGVGFADICYNGKWVSNRECKTVLGFDVSCKKRCNNPDGCNADEYVSVCGECKNEDDRICIGKNNPYNIVPEYEWVLLFCKEGDLEFNTQVPCEDDCKDEANRMACLKNVP